MQFTKVSNVIGASLLAGTLSLGAAVIPAQAQNQVVPPTQPLAQTQPQLGDQVNIVDDEDGFDWGWLGLLGLIGLAGLAGKKNHDTSRTETYTSDPTVTTNPDYRR